MGHAEPDMASAYPNPGLAQSFSSQPKAVAPTRKKKFREPGELSDTGVYRDLKETCISWDKRVHRGNTYGLYTQNAIKEALQDVVAQAAPAAPRKKRKPPEPSLFDQPLPERERIPVDLTPYLVAKEEVITTETVEAQTDEFLPEPPPEHYRPQKTGMDVATQVEDGELFHFDAEVEPILDVLISKTLEQATMETQEEHELEQMTDFKAEWYTRQAQMMQDWDEQVAEEWVRWHAKEEVMRERREHKRKEARVLLKVQGMALAKQHLQALLPNAMSDINELAFPDIKASTVTRTTMPKLQEQAQKDVEAKANSIKTINNVTGETVQARLSVRKAGYEEQRRRDRQLRLQRYEELQIRHGKIKITMDDGAGGEKVIGPIQISSKDSIDDVQQRVYDWVKEKEAELARSWPHGVLICIEGEAAKETADIFNAMPGQISIQKPEPPKLEEDEADAEGEGADGEGQGDQS